MKIDEFSNINLMKINEKKTKLMVFNTSKLYDFPPEFSFSNDEILECVDEYKLLGIQIHSNLKWDTHVNE